MWGGSFCQMSYVHPFHALHKIGLVLGSIALTIILARLIGPWLDYGVVAFSLSKEMGTVFDLVGALVGIFSSAALLSQTALPKWLPTLLHCRLFEGAKISAEIAEQVGFMFDGSLGGRIHGLNLRSMPLGQRTLALQLVANRTAEKHQLIVPFPELDAAQREWKRRETEERTRRERAQQSHQRSNSSYAELDFHLSVLGFSSRPASFKIIKLAYRKLIRQYHPDNFPNERASVIKMSNEMTNRLNQAYAYVRTAYEGTH
jgi:hypothetical protein